MKFTRLVIENYKSFQFATAILFPVGADGKSIFLIGGMNGAGKTSIILKKSVEMCRERFVLSLSKHEWFTEPYP